MPAGAPLKFSATMAETVKRLRNAREFEHLRGMNLHVISVVVNPDQWTEFQQIAYETAVPHLLLLEKSNMMREIARSGKNGLFFPNAVFRRAAFLFGSKCAGCSKIYNGYFMLPLSKELTYPTRYQLRKPFYNDAG